MSPIEGDTPGVELQQIVGVFEQASDLTRAMSGSRASPPCLNTATTDPRSVSIARPALVLFHLSRRHVHPQLGVLPPVLVAILHVERHQKMAGLGVVGGNPDGELTRDRTGTVGL